MSGFSTWWHQEGSDLRPRPEEDAEEFARRICEIAWDNGGYVEREACARVCEDINAKYAWPADIAERVASQWCADAIRARGQQ